MHILPVLNSLAFAEPNYNPPNEFLGDFTMVESGFLPSGSISLYWSILDRSKVTERIRYALVFNGTKFYETAQPDSNPNQFINRLWMGFGWGPSMLNSNFLLVYVPANSTTPKVIEAISSQKYSPPLPATNTVITTGYTSVENNVVIVEFFRPTLNVDSSYHRTINVEELTHHIFAFNPNPPANSINGWQYWHGPNRRGSYLIRYSDGKAGPIDVTSLESKRIHGIGMASIWLLIFPATIFFTRFFRHVNDWIWIHIIIQTTISIVGVFGFGIYIILNLPGNFGTSSILNVFPRPHSINGVVILALTALQGLLGLFNRLSFSKNEWNVDKSRFYWVKFCHNWLGRILIMDSFVQAGLGLDILYPIITLQYYGYEIWLAYTSLIAFWILAFSIYELYHVKRRKRVGEKPEFDKGRLLKNPIVDLDSVNYNAEITELRTYTWKDIDDALVKNDELLVVAQGRYIYKINTWIGSHPGGQIILHSVAGTDVTNDYFFEAGYDVEQFIPKKNNTTKKRAMTSTNMARNSRLVIPSKPRQSTISNNILNLNETEWKNVLKARRTHIHTHSALRKLSSLLVGELKQNHYTGIYEQAYDHMEYRRYAIVKNEMETMIGSVCPVFRIKFCLLYPFDSRVGEPNGFLPGQAVEIQTRLNGEYVSRYYTPLNGTLSSFEICVKVVSTGKMSTHLSRQRVGDRQFKIRGPFGTPIINPDRPLSLNSDSWAFNTTVFIAGGSGMAPALQLLSTMFLPAFAPLYVQQTYIPVESDEIELFPGDWVVVQEHLFDGWAIGVNLRTQDTGVFPLPVTVPYCGPSCRLVIMNASKSPMDVFGSKVLNGAMLAYPEYVSIHHAFSRGTPTELSDNQRANLAPGYQTNTRFIPSQFEEIIFHDARWDLNASPAEQRIILCGPSSLLGASFDIITERLKIQPQFLRILSADSLD